MNRLIKTFLLFLALVGAYTVGYFREEMDGVLHSRVEEEPVEVTPKKISPSKSKWADVRSQALDPVVIEKEKFTFFETLVDPGMEKVVALAVKMTPPARVNPQTAVRTQQAPRQVTRVSVQRQQPRPVSPPLEKESQPPKVVPPKVVPPQSISLPVPKTIQKPPPQQVRVAAKVKKKEPPRRGGRYAVQISSFRNRDQAETLKGILQRNGHYPFLLQSGFPGQASEWYRVFSGRYSNYEEAKRIAETIRRREKMDAVVVMLAR